MSNTPTAEDRANALAEQIAVLVAERDHLRRQRNELQTYNARLLEERTRPAEVARLRAEVNALKGKP